jgi:hypothetical protein
MIDAQKWEYCRLRLYGGSEDESIRDLNRHGRDGWELCFEWNGWLYMKRPIQ